MIKYTSKGDFKKTIKFLTRLENLDFAAILGKYAERGVSALSAATPKEDGSTAASWGYEIVNEGSRVVIYWTNMLREFIHKIFHYRNLKCQKILSILFASLVIKFTFLFY